MHTYFLKGLVLLITHFAVMNKCSCQKDTFSEYQKKYDFYFDNNKLDSALIYAENMKIWAMQNGGDTSLKYAITYRLLGRTYNKIGLLDSTEKCYKTSLEILTNQNRINGIDYAKCSYNLGLFYQQNKFDLKAAFYYSNQSSKIFKEIKGIDDIDFVRANYLLGMVNHQLGNYDMSEKIYLNALEKNSSLIEHIHILDNLGNLYRDMGVMDKSEHYFLTALKEYNQIIDRENIFYAVILNDIGGFYFLKGEYKNAEKYLLESKNIFLKNKNNFTENSIQNLLNLGDLFQKMGDIKSSENYFLQVNKFFEEKSNKLNPLYIRCCKSIGVLYLLKNENEKADYYIEKALELQVQIYGRDNREYARMLQTIGYAYRLNGQYSKAKKNIEAALNVYKHTIGINHSEYVNTLKMLGGINFLQGNIEMAITQLENAVELSKEQDSTSIDYCMNLYALGYFFSAKGDYISANNLYIESYKLKLKSISTDFTWLSSEQKNKYWNNEHSYFEHLIEFSTLFYDTNPYSSILSLNSILISKSLILESSRELNEILFKSNDSESKSLFAQLKMLRMKSYKLQGDFSMNIEDIKQIQSKVDSLDNLLIKRNGDYSNAKRKFDVTWEDVRKNLMQNEAAVEFARYFDYSSGIYKYIAYVIKPEYEYPHLVNIGSEINIKNACIQKDFSELYNYVWRGIDSLLIDVKTVYYSPVGEINNVSFSALRHENRQYNQSESLFDNWSYLIDDYNMHQLTSTRYLADESIKNTQSISNSIKLIGGVNYSDLPIVNDEVFKTESNEDFALQLNIQSQKNIINYSRGGKLNFLYETEMEVSNIANALANAGWKYSISNGRNANEFELKYELNEKSPGILHIATHGFAFPEKESKDRLDFQTNENSPFKYLDDPMVRCGLMLSGANITWSGDTKKMINLTGDDGILTAAEVANIDLSNTKLVVLSACQSGLGKIESSEGTFGLTRGFKLAGVEQLIVSLWSVPDKETMELMTLFYTELAKTNDIDSSFNKAQKEMRNLYPNEPE